MRDTEVSFYQNARGEIRLEIGRHFEVYPDVEQARLLGKSIKDGVELARAKAKYAVILPFAGKQIRMDLDGAMEIANRLLKL